MKKIALFVSAALVSGAMANLAHANELYLGGKLGYNRFNDACYLNAPCDDESVAVSGHLGYRFTPYVAAEYGVDYLGSFTSNVERSGLNTVDGEMWALTLAPKFNLPLGDAWNLFVKVGGAYMMAGDEQDFVPTSSLGAEVKLDDHWSLRAEYQRYDGLSDELLYGLDSDYLGVGVNYTFHSEKAPTPAPMVKLVETVPVTQLVVHHYPAQTLTVPFDLEGTTLKDATPLNDVVELLNAYPEAQVEIIGYSDTSGSAAYNQQLTEQRAQSVAAQFIALGISEDRLSVQGFGEANPVASNDTRQGREANRRVEITVPAFQYEMIESAAK